MTVLTLTADDFILLLYLDGIQITALPNASKWDVPDTVDLPATTKVIAVHAMNWNSGGYGGLLVSDTSGRILTDSTWRCSTTKSSGWMNVTFDDSGWSKSAILFNNSGSEIYGLIPGIHADAWWIWNAAKSVDTLIYFRFRLPDY